MRAIRYARGLTQEQLASALDLQTPAISRIETGHTGVSLTVAAHLAQALGVPMSDLFADEPPTSLEALDAEERALLRTWRSLDPRTRVVVRSVVSWAAGAAWPDPEARRGST